MSMVSFLYKLAKKTKSTKVWILFARQDLFEAKINKK